MESSSSSQVSGNGTADSDQVREIRMVSPSPNQVANLPPNRTQPPSPSLQWNRNNRGSRPRPHNRGSWYPPRSYSRGWESATHSVPSPLNPPPFLMPPVRSSGYGNPMIPPPYPGFVPQGAYYITPRNYMFNPSSLPPLPWTYQPCPSQDFSLYWRIINQVNFYFSDRNLNSDFYLKQHMDDNGWVPIKLIAGFNRMKLLTNDVEYILFALRGSSVVEVEGDKIRRRKIIRRYNGRR